MCTYSPKPHTLPCCALIGECALIRSNTVIPKLGAPAAQPYGHFGFSVIYEQDPKYLIKGLKKPSHISICLVERYAVCGKLIH